MNKLLVFTVLVCVAATEAAKQKNSGLLEAVICEGKRHSITCPAGKSVSVVYANYGRFGSRRCPHRSIRATSCYTDGSSSLVRNSCSGLRSCSLYASNRIYGDPCVGTYKYLHVFYKCIPNKVASNNMVVCEHRRKSIACPRGLVINIKNAVYGRSDRKTCPHSSIRTTSCKASSSLARVRSRCQSKRSCSLHASNSVFGDPCVGTYKYLTVSFNCVRPLRPTQVVACENRQRTIRCSAGRKIRILYANYGRTDRGTCPSRYIRTTSCFASSSVSKVRAACNNKNSCILKPYNSVFGDPCGGTYKYLFVRYVCS